MSSLLCTVTTLTFFQIFRNLPSFRDCLNITLKGAVNDSLQILIIFIEVHSWNTFLFMHIVFTLGGWKLRWLWFILNLMEEQNAPKSKSLPKSILYIHYICIHIIYIYIYIYIYNVSSSSSWRRYIIANFGSYLNLFTIWKK